MKGLHAKCCMGDNIAIITSMNLYEFSQANSKEMGIAIYGDGDRKVYD